MVNSFKKGCSDWTHQLPETCWLVEGEIFLGRRTTKGNILSVFSSKEKAEDFIREKFDNKELDVSRIIPIHRGIMLRRFFLFGEFDSYILDPKIRKISKE